MIGIDINDFILEAALNLPMKLPIFRFPIGTTVLTTPLTGEILNGISYNTNSDKLIEEIHLHINTCRRYECICRNRYCGKTGIYI